MLVQYIQRTPRSSTKRLRCALRHWSQKAMFPGVRAVFCGDRSPRFTCGPFSATIASVCTDRSHTSALVSCTVATFPPGSAAASDDEDDEEENDDDNDDMDDDGPCWRAECLACSLSRECDFSGGDEDEAPPLRCDPPPVPRLGCEAEVDDAPALGAFTGDQSLGALRNQPLPVAPPVAPSPPCRAREPA